VSRLEQNKEKKQEQRDSKIDRFCRGKACQDWSETMKTSKKQRNTEIKRF
jgi:hypothetical protein